VVREQGGDLLRADAEALVNTVNTVGVMGKGIALQFKRAFPAMFRDYEKAAKAGEITLGQVHVWPTGTLGNPRFIINFPTKGHWRARSRLTDIEAGLGDLVRVVRELDIQSIALPPLGCGNGGLRWPDVRAAIERAFAQVPDVDVAVYPPDGTPPAAAMVRSPTRPAWTAARAVLVAALARYEEVAFGASPVETQKLAYFLQVAGEPLKLRFSQGRFGPYADNLRHVLNRLEGHQIVGFGDGTSATAFDAALHVVPPAAAEAAEYLADHPESRERLVRVATLLEGFESAYSLELLATVHWLATVDAPQDADDVDAIARLVGEWSTRKRGLFGRDHVLVAWEHLRAEGWLEPAMSGSATR
jgi:O-acetyl-ADP-ribose deacetylase (regulator of RNase III)